MSERVERARADGAASSASGQFQALLAEFGDLLSEGERELFSDPTRNGGGHAAIMALVEVRRVKQEVREVRALLEEGLARLPNIP